MRIEFIIRKHIYIQIENQREKEYNDSLAPRLNLDIYFIALLFF